MLREFRIWLYRRLTLNFMTAGKTHKAEIWCRRLESLEPESLSVLHNLGVIYISLYKYAEAEKYLLREIELYGESDIRSRILGDLYFAGSNREKSLKSYRKALTLLRKGKGDRSTEKFLMKRITQCSEQSSFYRALEGIKYYEEGLNLYSRGEYKKAFELYEKSIQSDNANFMALNGAGTVLMNSIKDYERARSFFLKALDLAEIPLIRGNLALAEYKIKETGGEQ